MSDSDKSSTPKRPRTAKQTKSGTPKQKSSRTRRKAVWVTRQRKFVSRAKEKKLSSRDAASDHENPQLKSDTQGNLAEAAATFPGVFHKVSLVRAGSVPSSPASVRMSDQLVRRSRQPENSESESEGCYFSLEDDNVEDSQDDTSVESDAQDLDPISSSSTEKEERRNLIASRTALEEIKKLLEEARYELNRWRSAKSAQPPGTTQDWPPIEDGSTYQKTETESAGSLREAASRYSSAEGVQSSSTQESSSMVSDEKYIESRLAGIEKSLDERVASMTRATEMAEARFERAVSKLGEDNRSTRTTVISTGVAIVALVAAISYGVATTVQGTVSAMQTLQAEQGAWTRQSLERIEAASQGRRASEATPEQAPSRDEDSAQE